MCHNAVSLISKALEEVDNAETVLRVKNLVALFMQTMNVRCINTIHKIFSLLSYGADIYIYIFFWQTWGFPVNSFDTLLLTLFEKYAELLKKRFSDDFQEVGFVFFLFLWTNFVLIVYRLFRRMTTCLCLFRTAKNMTRF